MTNSMKKSISLLLVLVQLFALFPVLQPQAEAAQSGGETPVLNKTIVGTVDFQAFNLLGENETGTDGTDYHSTFYYSDDYFAPSAVNEDPSITDQTQTWEKLENRSLAACSAAFAFASFTSNIGNVTSNTSNSGKGSWENSNYTNKDSNVKSFLGQCKFEHIETFGLTEKPTIDSIGYTIAHKTIHVWDEESKTNKDYTLIAVGVRGAGYDSEWANNVTIGNPETDAHEMPNGRHWGFDDGAKTVCSEIQRYLSRNTITGEVKYWVTGFSRAAAVANLVAGYLTVGGRTYLTQKKDVFGYTWECPQAASTDENALDYKNIHNIINPMDAVPKVSPDEFQHQRLGVDYQMPYYGNTNSKSNNTQYYNRMWEVIKTIIRTDDPLYKAVNPNNYPYNAPITPYTITPTQLLADAGEEGKLAENFGTVLSDPTYEYQEKHTFLGFTYYTTETHTGNVSSMLGDETGDRVCDWYMDQFIEHLIDVFLESNAWDRHYSGTTTDAVVHRTRFINTYQKHFRNVLGYMLDYSGPAFLGLVTQLVDAVGEQLSLSNLLDNGGLALAFTNFYAYPNSTYELGLPPFIDGWVGNPLWIGSTRKDVLISEAQPVVKNVIHNMIPDRYDGQNGSGITRSQFDASMDYLVELVVDLYADELSRYSSQYFGTSLHFLNEILCTHLQETVLSWIMSLDPNHMNRNTRTILLPTNCSAKLLEFRPEYTEYDGSPEDADAAAPVVAAWENRQFILKKDDRISVIPSGSADYVTIRYPASLDIRVDITPSENLDLRYGAIATDDYRPGTQTFDVSAGPSQYQKALSSNSAPSSDGYSYVTENPTYSNAKATNSLISGYGTLEAGDTLHVIADGTDTYGEKMTYTLLVDKAPTTVIADYSSGGGLTAGDSADSAVTLGGVRRNKSETVVNQIKTRRTENVVPASCIYYDDELAGNSATGYNAVTTRLDWSDETQESVDRTFWFRFSGTRIDVYCTTDSSNGYIQAAITDESGAIQTVDGRLAIALMKNQSSVPRYNVPTITFSGLNPGQTYYLKLMALSGSNYCLDGIRVYHSEDEADSAVKTAYEAAGEQNAKYVNLRTLLLGIVTEETVDSTTAASAMFYTDSGISYELTSSEYQTDSPKNEIYLKTGESVAFQIVGEYEKVAVGLSAPESKTNGGSVTVTNGNGTKNLPVADALDQYYEINPAPGGSVVIRNNSTAMIAVTNVKLSGDYTPPAIPESVGPLRVSKSLMRYAADFAQLPAAEETEVTPEPTADLTDAIRQLISSFVSSLFGSISRLFGN